MMLHENYLHPIKRYTFDFYKLQLLIDKMITKFTLEHKYMIFISIKGSLGFFITTKCLRIG